MEIYRIQEGASLYFLTFTVLDWLPVFSDEASRRIITESLNFCHREKGLRINAYVIMPTHLHLVVFDSEFNPDRLSQTIASFRRFTGHEMVRFCKTHSSSSFLSSMLASERSDRQYQFWQQSWHPEAISTHAFWREKVLYLHDNPRRKGLVRGATDWLFSSAAYWLSDPPGPSGVVPRVLSGKWVLANSKKGGGMRPRLQRARAVWRKERLGPPT